MTAPQGEIRIDVVSDVVCPWCLIGSRRLDLALAQVPGVKADVVFRPFLLDPALPAQGDDLRSRLRRKFGDPEPLFRRVEKVARADGIDLDFARVGRYASTVGAHTLLRHAIARGTQRALARSLFGAYFLEGRDVGDLEVLAALGEANGFTRADAESLVRDEGELEATRSEARANAARGISGVPHVTIGGVAMAGAQPVATFRAAIERAVSGQA
jgi:predicted DsbA family dithiol-disulfide isomerase